MKHKGWKQNSVDDRDNLYGVHRLTGTAGVVTLPEEIDLSSYVYEVFHQGQTSSCVGHALAQAIRIRQTQLLSKIVEKPSPLFIYALARQNESALDRDEGCMPRSALKALMKLGFCSERCWPLKQETLFTMPSATAFQDAYDHRFVGGYYNLLGNSTQSRAQQIRIALYYGYPVVFGMQVDEAFEDYTGGISARPTGELLGGHMMCLLGYGPGYFRGVNSWGENWGENGFFRITEDIASWKLASDFTAIQTVQ